MARILTYAEKDTWIHRLSGVTKLLFFLVWSVVGMLTYDTRVLLFMLVFSLAVFKVSKTDWHQVGVVFLFILTFLALNLVAIFVIAPCGTSGRPSPTCHLERKIGGIFHEKVAVHPAAVHHGADPVRLRQCQDRNP